MRALYVILPILGILAIAYRYYSAFIAARVMCLDDSRPTPAHVRPDGQNYHVTTRWVLFGHHFAAIAGAGPLIGPVLAAQFGYAPGLIWLVGGVCLAGAVHDMIFAGLPGMQHLLDYWYHFAIMTIAPLAFVAITTLTAGALGVRDNFYPMAVDPDPAKHFQGYLNSTLTVVMMLCVMVILASAVRRWIGAPRTPRRRESLIPEP